MQAPSTSSQKPRIFRACRSGDDLDAARAGRILGYDADRMAFEFTMQNKGQTVPCEISSAPWTSLQASVARCLPSARLNFRVSAKRLNALLLIISIATLLLGAPLSAFSQSIFEVRHNPISC
jgi:hypothetical protein